MLLEDDHYCFVCGKRNPRGLKLIFSASKNKASVEFTLDKSLQGYKNIIHGGIIAAILDEAMVKAAIGAGLNAVTAEMTKRFRTPLKAGERAYVEAEITESGKRLVGAKAVIKNSASVVVAEGHGKLIVVTE